MLVIISNYLTIFLPVYKLYISLTLIVRKHIQVEKLFYAVSPVVSKHYLAE